VAVADLVVVEVRSFEHRRIHGASNLNAVSDGLRVLRTIFRERERRRHASLPAEPARQAADLPSASSVGPAPAGAVALHDWPLDDVSPVTDFG